MAESNLDLLEQLITEIKNAELPESVTNVMVARALTYLSDISRKLTADVSATVDTIKANTEAIEVFDKSIGQPAGLVPLGIDGLISPNFLPEYVNDVVEFDGVVSNASFLPDDITVITVRAVYYDSARKYFVSSVIAHLGGPNTTSGYMICQNKDIQNGSVPYKGKLYIDTTNNRIYRWGGTDLEEVNLLSPSTAGYEESVNTLIRQRYTLSQELAILRQRDTKPDEYAEYYAYCEQCKAECKENSTDTI